jgi:hypothetical protein
MHNQAHAHSSVLSTTLLHSFSLYTGPPPPPPMVVVHFAYTIVKTKGHTSCVYMCHAVSWKSEQQLPSVYDPGYNITLLGLEKLHPFDSCKFSKVGCCDWPILHPFYQAAAQDMCLTCIQKGATFRVRSVGCWLSNKSWGFKAAAAECV